MAYTGFTIPDLVDAPFSPQAKVASEDWQIVADGLRGNGVQAGCVVSQRAAGANMSVDVSAGTINREGTAIAVTSGNLVIAAADGTNPRIDIVAVNNAGTKAVTTGTPAAVPAPPAIPQVGGINNIVLAFVYIPAGDTTINTTQIIDKRALVNAPGGVGSGTVTTSGGPVGGNLTQFSGGTVITNGNLSGDVTTAGTLAATIAANAVSYAKMQDVTAASRLLGRGAAAGAGDPQEITLGPNLSMSGTVLNASGSGTTPTGTGFTHITAGAQDAAAKLVDTADVNNDQVTYAKIQNVSAASRLLGRGDSGSGDPQEITLGANLSITGTTLAASGSGGTITVRKNTGADVGTRARLNLIEGSNVTLTVADDAGGNEVDITIAAGAGSSDTVVALAADVLHATNSTTLENVTGLTFSTTASPTELWRVDVALITTANATAGSAAKFKFGWTFPGGVTGFWASQVEREQGTGGSQPLAPSIAVTLAFASASSVAQGMIHFTAMIASNGNAGAVQLQFAQNALTSAGALLTIKRMSNLIARKVAS